MFKKALFWIQWVWHNAQPVYYVVAGFLLLFGAWRTYRADADEKQAYTESMQMKTDSLIRQQPHHFRDSLRADMHEEIKPLSNRVDSIQKQTSEIAIEQKVIHGQIEILSREHSYGER